MIILGIILLVAVWLIVGAIAAGGQRGYFTHAAQNCASAGTMR